MNPASGQNYKVTFKVVTGLGFSNFPTLSGNTNLVGSQFETVSNTITASAAGSLTTITNSESSVYGSAKTVGSTQSGSYTLTLNLNANLANPFAYVQFNSAGPVPDSSMCANSFSFTDCRVYNGINSLVVARSASSSTNSLVLASSATAITYPAGYSSNSANYTVTALVGSGSSYSRTSTVSRTQANLVPAVTTVYAQQDFFTSKKSGYNSVLVSTFQLAVAFAPSHLLQLIFSGVTIAGDCSVSIASNPSTRFMCLVAGSTISVYTNATFSSTSVQIAVFVGVTNPSADPTVRVRHYKSYASSGSYVALSDSVGTYSIDATDNSLNRMEKSRLLKLPFYPRMYTASNAPIRVRFKLNSNIAAEANQVLTLAHPRLAQVAAVGNVYCFLREYGSLDVLEDSTLLHMQGVKSTAGGTVLHLDAPRTAGLSAASYYELAVLPLLNSNVLAASVIDSGFEQVANFASVEFRAGAGSLASLQAVDVRRWHSYEGLGLINLNSIMTLTTYTNSETSLLINFQLNFASSAEFPGEVIDIILPDIPVASIDPGSVGLEPSCYLNSAFTTKAARQPVKCVLTQLNSYQNMAKLTIYNLGTFGNPSYFSLGIDKVTLPNLAAKSLLEDTYKLDVQIEYYKASSNTKYSAYFREVLVVQGLSASPTAASATYNQGVSQTRGDPVSNSISGIAWPSTAGANISSKMVFTFTGGQVALLADPASLAMSGQTLLFYFKKTLKYVYLAPAQGAGTVTFTLTGLANPHNYQASLYGSPQTTLALYSQYGLARTYSAPQPAFSTFTARNMLFAVQTNSPSFDTDLYAGAEGRVAYGPNMHVHFKLLLSIQESAASIGQLTLSRLQVAFTAGVKELAGCSFLLLDGSSPSSQSLCAVASANTVVIPQLGLLDVSQQWVLRVRGSFSGASVTFSTTVFTAAGVVEYSSSGSTASLTAGGFSSAMLVSLSSQSDNKYTRYYFESFIAKVYGAFAGGATMPKGFVHLTVPEGMVRLDSQYFSLGLSNDHFDSSTGANLRCQLLQQVGFRQFTVGRTGYCHKSSATVRLESPLGSTPAGSYLFQMDHANPTTSSFKVATPLSSNIESAVIWQAANTNAGLLAFNYPLPLTSLRTKTVNNLINDHDTIELEFAVPASTSASAASPFTSAELYCELAFASNYVSPDFGYAQAFASYGLDYQNGQSIPTHMLFNGLGRTGSAAILNEGSYSNKKEPVLFTFYLAGSLAASTTYNFKLPLLLNPGTAMLAYTLEMTVYRILSTNLAPITLFQ